jgi:ELWxxDGT repeat protein
MDRVYTGLAYLCIQLPPPMQMFSSSDRRIFASFPWLRSWKSTAKQGDCGKFRNSRGTAALEGIQPIPVAAHSSSAALRRATRHLAIAAFALLSTALSAAPPVLLKDINTNADQSGVSPTALCAVGSTVYFIGTDPLHGQELWKSDGTPAGTSLVNDISPGETGSTIANAVAVGSTLFFTASNGAHGLELWKSDGTAAGTVMVKDIAAGAAGSAPGVKFVIGDVVYFAANDAVSGVELWKSDGTPEGTVMVKGIMPGGNAMTTLTARAVGSTLFFVANDGVRGSELWKTDGTPEGTGLVKDVRAGNEPTPAPTDLVAVGNTLYFTHADSGTNTELWKSDGTDAGTVLVKDIVAGVTGSGPANKVDVGGVLLFTATDAANGNELWRSDGTEAGTVIVKDLLTGTGSSLITPRVVVNGVYYFTASVSGFGNELCRSDGTAAGTGVVRDLTVGTGGSTFNFFGVVGNSVFFDFGLFASPAGRELWVTDGTFAGTVQVKDLWVGTSGSNPREFVAVNGKACFVASTGADNGLTVTSTDLWQSDGTANGTAPVKPLSQGTASSAAASRLAIGNTLFVGASDGVTGFELWTTDGTAAGTSLLKDINPGSNGSGATFFTNVDGTIYFRADNGTNGAELWKTDGTTAGTVLVKDIAPGVSASAPRDLVALNGVLYFVAGNPSTNQELWRSDGTDAGTVLLKDIFAGSLSGSPSGLTVFNGAIYFSANDGTNGIELWRSDGTAAGTVMLKNISPNGGTSSPSQFKVVGQTLYFSANDGTNGFELWKTDGTPEGTVLVKNIHPTGNASPNRLTAVGSTLFFTATDGVSGVELWKSDGTDAGTVLVKDIVPGAGGPAGLTAFAVAGNVLYFPASDGSTGVELWRSDGTEAGTALLREIRPGSGNSDPRNFLVVGDWLYFSANDGVSGHELWTSDGSAAGTVMVADLTGESGSSIPGDLVLFRGKVVFSAVTPTLGQELWSYAVPIPEIEVKLADATLVDGDLTPIDFGSLLVGRTQELTFTINDVKDFPLSGLHVTTGGTDAADFTVTTQPSGTVAGGSSTTFTVRFAPGTEGAKSATIHIASNDPDENPFDIVLSGHARLPMPGVISLNLAPGGVVFVNEAAGVLNLPVIRTGGTDFNIGFTATATPDSASAGSDYVMPAGPFTLADGASTLSIPIVILDPPQGSEKNETFTVTLSAPTGGATLGAVTSVTVLIVDSKDNGAPGAPSIQSPAQGQTVNLAAGQSLPVSGKATDNRGVARVELSLNGGPFVDAALASPGASQSHFSATVAPVEGTNTLVARSTDTSGLVSSLTTRVFYVDSPLTVTAAASQGSVSPSSFMGKSFRKPGKSYTITATGKSAPAPGYVFSHWVIGGGFTTQDISVTAEALKKPSLTFMHRGGLELTAEFVPNEFAVVAGTYHGLIRSYGGPIANGAITFCQQSNGGFSAKIVIDGEQFHVCGQLDTTGNASFGKTNEETLLLERRGKPDISIDLQLDLAEGAALAGLATQDDPAGGLLVSSISANRAVFDGVNRLVPAEYLGPNGSSSTFTMVLDVADSQPLLLLDPEDSPQGYSFATISLTKSGCVHFSGCLSDGTKVTASSTFTEDALQALVCPIHALLYQHNAGFFATQLVFDASQPDSDLTAVETLWSRPPQPGSEYPDGWSVGLFMDAVGARYLVTSGQSVLPAPDGADEDLRGDLLAPTDVEGNAELTFEGRERDPIVKSVNVSPQDSVGRLPQSDHSFVLSIICPQGRINGHFDHPDKKNMPKPAFDGVIFQKGAHAGAYGFFSTKKPLPNDPDRGFGSVTLFSK